MKNYGVNMKEYRYSENAIKDIWKGLLKFSYIANIDKYLKIDLDDILKNSIAGSIIQSYEYFNSFNNVTLNTSPLLIYYGFVNLLYASALLKTKKTCIIKNHGMSLKLSDSSSIGDTTINLSKSTEGALKKYVGIFSPDIIYPNNISIKDVFSLIPELKIDFEECYSDCKSLCLPVETIVRREDIVERIDLKSIHRELSEIDIIDYEQAYISPQKTNKYIILRKKLESNDIGVISISGQKYLIQFYRQNSKKYKISQLIAFQIGLFSLGYLSRYHPEIWYTFVRSDQSGEKSLVEEFLNISYRKIPHLLLDIILDKEIIFSNKHTGTIDISKDINEDYLSKLVKDEIRKT